MKQVPVVALKSPGWLEWLQAGGCNRVTLNATVAPFGR